MPIKTIFSQNPTDWDSSDNEDVDSQFVRCIALTGPLKRTGIKTSEEINIPAGVAECFLEAEISSIDIKANDNAFISIKINGTNHFDDYQIHALKITNEDFLGNPGGCQIWTNRNERKDTNLKVQISPIKFSKYIGKRIQIQIMVETKNEKSAIKYSLIKVFTSTAPLAASSGRGRRPAILPLNSDGNPGSGTTGPRQPPRG